ncbi:MAG: hypothetical protein U0625_09790 [Phycisphaerales bacterium]
MLLTLSSFLVAMECRVQSSQTAWSLSLNCGVFDLTWLPLEATEHAAPSAFPTFAFADPGWSRSQSWDFFLVGESRGTSEQGSETRPIWGVVLVSTLVVVSYRAVRALIENSRAKRRDRTGSGAGETRPRATLLSRAKAFAGAMRWPVAGLASLVCVGTLLSMAYGVSASHWLSEDSVVYISVDVGVARIRYLHGPDTRYRDQTIEGFQVYRTKWSDKTKLLSYFRVQYVPWNRQNESGGTLYLALWWCILGLGAAAWMCFGIRRRLPVPGLCPRCRHPLAGASVCPECGEAAADSKSAA